MARQITACKTDSSKLSCPVRKASERGVVARLHKPAMRLRRVERHSLASRGSGLVCARFKALRRRQGHARHAMALVVWLEAAASCLDNTTVGPTQAAHCRHRRHLTPTLSCRERALRHAPDHSSHFKQHAHIPLCPTLMHPPASANPGNKQNRHVASLSWQHNDEWNGRAGVEVDCSPARSQ